MTPEKMIEQAELMLRYAKSVQEGKPIELECRSLSMNTWGSLAKDGPNWNFGYAEYREKPKPQLLWAVYLGDRRVGIFEDEEDACKSMRNVNGHIKLFEEVVER